LCTHFVDFGPIIGTVAIVDNAPDTLLSVYALANKGLSITFASDRVSIHRGDHTGDLLYTGKPDSDTHLYYLDMDAIMQCSVPTPTPPTFTELVPDLGKSMPIAAFFNTVKSIPSNIVNEILWLHKRMGHPSRGVMSKAIRERSWIGIPSHITALISDHAMKRNPCTACDMHASLNAINFQYPLGVEFIQLSLDLYFLLIGKVR
jgi:hypothetical protein